MRRLPAQLLLASLVLTGVLVLVAALSMRALVHAGALTEALGERQLEALEQSEQLEDLLYQKGYVSNYFLTHDRRWLEDLEGRKKATRAWLDRVSAEADTDEEKRLAKGLQDAYAEFDQNRDAQLAAFEAGQFDKALPVFDPAHSRINRVLEAAHAFSKASKHDLRDTLAHTADLVDSARWFLIVITLVASVVGIGFGVWNGRRIARPIYELILQAESADPERVRLSSTGSEAEARPETLDELALLSRHVTGMVSRLSEQRRRLVQAEKMAEVGEIAAKLAHEILNPVAAAKAALQVEMRTRALPDATRANLGEADRALSRVDGIMARLIKYARPLEPRRQAADVAQVVETGIAAARAALAEAEVKAETSLPRLPRASLDPDLVSQVLTNLVVNAAQASPRGSQVSVKAYGKPHALVLEVVDRGHGLPRQRDRLFRPYFTTREKGNGLGLAVCRNIVAEHGGTIEASDGPEGKGARFVITLPQQENAWANPS